MMSEQVGDVVETEGGANAAAQAEGPKVGLAWLRPLRMVMLSLKIYFLKMLTFGIYHFWGKAEVRRKIWSAVHIEGQPVEYTGTGKELFLGFLVAFFVVMLPIYIAFQALPFLGLYIIKAFPQMGPFAMIGVVGGGQAVLFAVVFYFIGVAHYRARRYRLSRSQWRGIRGAMAGSPWRYGWTYLWTLLLLPLTLGWLTPWRNITLQKKLTDDTRFGEAPMSFKGRARPLYKPFALMWVVVVLAVPLAVGLFLYPGAPSFANGASALQLAKLAALVGGALIAAGATILAVAWYMSREFNYIAAATHLDQAHFRLDSTHMGLIWLFIGNILIWLGVILAAFVLMMIVFAALFMAMGGPELVQQLEQLEKAQQHGGGRPDELPPAVAAIITMMIPFLLLAFMSSSIAKPLIAVRTARYFITRMGIHGEIDFENIMQSQQRVDKSGEGLAEAFDIDAF